MIHPGGGYTTPADVTLSADTGSSNEALSRRGLGAIPAFQTQGKPASYTSEGGSDEDEDDSGLEAGDAVEPSFNDAEYAPEQKEDVEEDEGGEMERMNDDREEEKPNGWGAYSDL